jgi:phosphoribosylformylglycinamidine cyclo-ligase
MTERQGISYQSVGVDYDVLDAGKRDALAAALATSVLAGARGAQAIDASRGEPAFLMKVGDRHLAMVLECLGTKSLLARQYQELTGVDRFDWVGFDAVAAIVNDLCCVGALPLMVNAYFATGSASWYEVPGRHASLVRGWREACERAGAVWGGGESPTLRDVVDPKEIDLAGCAVGFVPEGQRPLLGGNLRVGDEIVLVASSGLHTNGASLARVAAERVGGLDRTLPDGRTVGDALLAPSALYVDLIDALFRDGVAVNYASHVTGHGLRKLMRAEQELTYRVDELLPVPAVFDFITSTLGLDVSQAYGTFNMGVGFAVFCPAGEGSRAVAVAEATGHRAVLGGVVEKGPRQVVLGPVGVTFGDSELRLR